MNSNNRGFTLVELLVATAIFSIVALGAASLMTVSSRFYAGQSSLQKMQYNAQLTMTQIQEAVIDADTGLAWDSSTKTLYIVDTDDAGNENLTTCRYDSSDQTLYLANCTATATSSVPADENVMSQHITGFTVSFSPDLNDADIVKIGISLQYNDKTWSGEESYALRNKPYCSDSYSSLWSLMHP